MDRRRHRLYTLEKYSEPAHNPALRGLRSKVKKITLHPGVVSIAGSKVRGESTEDLDVVINIPDGIESQIKQTIEDVLGDADVKVSDGREQGHLPLWDLALVPHRPLGLVAARQLEGGPGSGHHGHKGVKGQRGGSVAGGAGGGIVAFEKLVAKGEVSSSDELGGGITETYLVTFEDGTQAVFKPVGKENPVQNMKNEVAAAQLGNLLAGEELVPTTVMGELGGKRGSFQRFVPNAEVASSRFKVGEVNQVAVAPHRTRLDAMLMLDTTIANTDRHRGNYLFNGKDKLWVIDNGMASWKVTRGTLPRFSSVFKGFKDSKKDQRGDVWPDFKTNSYKFGESSLARWKNVTRSQFDGTLKGLTTRKQADVAWGNFQWALESGGVKE